jgi:hypothetical protein
MVYLACFSSMTQTHRVLHALLDLPLHLFLLLVSLPTLLDIKAKENQLGNEEGSSAF